MYIYFSEAKNVGCPFFTYQPHCTAARETLGHISLSFASFHRPQAEAELWEEEGGGDRLLKNELLPG